MKQAIVLYMPVLHRGCKEFIVNNSESHSTVFLISESFIEEVNPDIGLLFQKNLHAMTVLENQKALAAVLTCADVQILDTQNLKGFKSVITPESEDDIVDAILLKYYPSVIILKKPGFIRWTKKTAMSARAIIPGATISSDRFDRDVMQRAFSIAQRSSDWWRQVGAIAFPLKGEPIQAFNHHFPHAEAPNIEGDPRSNFGPGVETEISTAAHAERSLISYAARKGVALEGASMYVTTFPCRPCAVEIIQSGIKTLYYCEGYSSLNAMELFVIAGVSVVFVEISL